MKSDGSFYSEIRIVTILIEWLNSSIVQYNPIFKGKSL